jgi:hypothetical protein
MREYAKLRLRKPTCNFFGIGGGHEESSPMDKGSNVTKKKKERRKIEEERPTCAEQGEDDVDLGGVCDGPPK